MFLQYSFGNYANLLRARGERVFAWGYQHPRQTHHWLAPRFSLYIFIPPFQERGNP